MCKIRLKYKKTQRCTIDKHDHYFIYYVTKECRKFASLDNVVMFEVCKERLREMQVGGAGIA